MRHLLCSPPPPPLLQPQECSAPGQEEASFLAPVHSAVPTSSIQSPPWRGEQEANPATAAPQCYHSESPTAHVPTSLSATGLAPDALESASLSSVSGPGCTPVPVSVPTQPAAELVQEVMPSLEQPCSKVTRGHSSPN